MGSVRIGGGLSLKITVTKKNKGQIGKMVFEDVKPKSVVVKVKRGRINPTGKNWTTVTWK